MSVTSATSGAPGTTNADPDAATTTATSTDPDAATPTAPHVGPGTDPHTAAYETTLALHALACLTSQPVSGGEDPARLNALVRHVADRAALLGAEVPLPVEPLDFSVPPPSLRGLGAIVAEDLEPGSAGLAKELASLRAAGLLDAVYGFLDRVEEVRPDWRDAGAAALPLPPPAPGTVHAVLRPAAGWSMVAAVGAAFHSRPPAEDGAAARAAVKPGSKSASKSAPKSAASARAPLGKDFHAEADRALERARRLAASHGLTQPPHVGADFDVSRLWAPSTARDGVSAAAVALTYLAGQADLPTPVEAGVLVLAGVGRDERWAPAPDEDELTALARRAGLGVLRPLPGGWVLEQGGTTATSSDTSLGGAAELLWGEGWPNAQQGWHARALAAQGWRILHSPRSAPRPQPERWQPDAGDPPVVATPQVTVLAQQFWVMPQLGLILGGPANSGKTTIARQLTRELEPRWNVVVLAPDDHRLPFEGELPGLVRSALALTGVRAGGRTLVVIEGLLPLDRGAIGAAVSSVVSQVGVSVLAVTRYAEGVEWDSGKVSSVQSVEGVEEVTALARRMADGYRGAIADRLTPEALSVLAEVCGGDLWLLSRLIRDLAARPGRHVPLRPDDVLAAFVAGALADVPPDHSEVLRLVAAVSQLGDGVPEDYVPDAARAVLDRFGARRVGGVVRFPSRRHAAQLFTAVSGVTARGVPGREAHIAAVVDCLAPHVLHLLDDGLSSRLLTLLRVCRAYNSAILTDLLDRPDVRERIVEWSATGGASTVATVLSLCDQVMEPGWVSPMVPAVMARVPQGKELVPRQLSSIARFMARHLHHGFTPQVLRDLADWLADPASGLAAVLSRPASAADRYFLARNLFRLYDERILQLILDHSEAFLQDVDPASAGDLISVRKLDVLMVRCRQELDFLATGPVRENPQTLNRRPLERYARTQDLLETSPPADARVGTIMAWLSLCLHFQPQEEWADLVASHELQLRAAFGRATVSEITLALADLSDNHRGFTTWMLNRLRIEDKLRTVLHAAAPADAAHLISTVAHIHFATAKYLLYSADDTPNHRLAATLAERIRKLGDGKGAGLLLSSAHRVDELYCSVPDSFAVVVAERLGEDFAVRLVRREKRPSVLYYFLRGLWEVGASYRLSVEDSAFEMILQSINSMRRANRPWAAQLALLLAEDDYFGEHMLHRLSREIDASALAHQMTQPGLRGEGLVHVHRLGRALHPEIPKDYRTQFHMDRLLARFVPASADSVAQSLRATATTLRMSGDEGANLRLLKRLPQLTAGTEESSPWDWGEALRKARHPSDVAQTLNNLRKLDTTVAREALDALDAPVDGRELSILKEFVLRSASTPEQVTQLLHAVDMIDHRLGRKLLDLLRGSQLWKVFTRELRYEQDPASQGRIGRHLAELGVMPARGDLEWMKRLVQEKWIKVASSLASPRAITELLRLACIWDDVWGQQLAAGFDAGRVLGRMDQGATADLQQVAGLLHALRLTGREPLAAEVAALLAEKDQDDLARRLGLAGSSLLLRQLHALGGNQAHGFAEALAGRLESALGRHLVIDPGAYWTSVGWAAQALRELEFGHRLPAGPPAFPVNTAFAAELCWAAAWLPESDWSRETLAAAFRVSLRAPRTSSQAKDVGMTLVAGARGGLLDDPGSDEAYWSAMADAGLGVLTLAYRESARHEGLAGLLSRLKRRMQDRVKVPVHRVDPWLPELREHIAASAGPTGPGPNDLFAPGGPFAR